MGDVIQINPIVRTIVVQATGRTHEEIFLEQRAELIEAVKFVADMHSGFSELSKRRALSALEQVALKAFDTALRVNAIALREMTEKEMYCDIVCTLVRWTNDQQAPCGWVYFIRSESTKLIKIGYSTRPKSRMKALQAGSGEKLTLLKKIPGSKTDESGFHRRFKMARDNGEWFRPIPELLAFVGQEPT